MLRVYIDEAGDRGHHPASSRHFVVSAVIVRDQYEAAARAELDALRRSLGRHSGHVVHFRKLTHAQKVKACQDVAVSSIATITNVIFCKTKIAGPMPGGRVAYIKQADPMYLYAVRLLLERVSWYVDEHGGGPAIVTFAHLTRFPSVKLHNYRQALIYSGTQIGPRSMDIHSASTTRTRLNSCNSRTAPRRRSSGPSSPMTTATQKIVTSANLRPSSTAVAQRH